MGPCQQGRYAGPRGRAALLRTFGTSPRRSPGRRAPQVSALQTAEVSRTVERARHTSGVAAGWYAGCTDPRVQQLLSTQRVRGAGDQVVLLVLRSATTPVTTLVVGMARTGESPPPP